MKQWIIILLIGVIVYGLGCKAKVVKGESGQSEKVLQPINPNGDSELALLMREMYDESERIKQEIAAGRKPTVNFDYKKVLTAEGTEPEKVASDTYHAFAQAYVGLMNALEEATADQAPAIFLNMVDNCMDCHTALCPGPRVRIKKLYSMN